MMNKQVVLEKTSSSACSLYTHRVGRGLRKSLEQAHTVLWSIYCAWDLLGRSSLYSLRSLIGVLEFPVMEATGET